MPDSYEPAEQVGEEPVEQPAEQSVSQPARPRKRPSIFRDPVVRWMAIVAIGLVILYMVMVLSMLVMGILSPREPRTRAERDIRYYETLTAQNPKDTDQWKQYIRTLIASKQYLKAQAMIDRATKSVDQKATQDIAAVQVELLYEQGKYKEAIKASDALRKKLKAFYDESEKIPGTAEAKGQEINDNYWTTLIVKSSAQEALGDKKGAAKTLDEYIKERPTAADVLVKRGLIRAALGDKKGAESDFRAALKYIPNDPAALDGLKQIGVEQ